MKTRNWRWTALLAVVAAAATTPLSAQTADTARTYELPEVEAQPVLANRADAARMLERTYPSEQRLRREEGTVTLRFLVGSDGVVDSARVAVVMATQPEFAEPATRVVRTMRFSPATVGGRPVPVWVTLPVTYMVHTRPAPPTWTPGSRP
ncbi:MAG TPA: energy transducer TonB [Longimicrobium sp.]|nr:energy transducer TonB [Longimicrobium sp.]